jgi:hypothetical protein
LPNAAKALSQIAGDRTPPSNSAFANVVCDPFFVRQVSRSQVRDDRRQAMRTHPARQRDGTVSINLVGGAKFRPNYQDDDLPDHFRQMPETCRALSCFPESTTEIGIV